VCGCIPCCSGGFHGKSCRAGGGPCKGGANAKGGTFQGADEATTFQSNKRGGKQRREAMCQGAEHIRICGSVYIRIGRDSAAGRA
jgi:hypothetical protein